MRPALALALGLVLLLPVASALIPALPLPPLSALPVQLPQEVPQEVPQDVPVVEATIYRDAFGVPHIFADDLYALYYANGYAQVQDRFFAMDALRHVGRGEAARVLGPGLFGSDVAVRRELYTEEDRLRKFLALDEDTKMRFSAFVDGVNRAIAEKAATGDIPAEFYALNHAPEPWTALDTIAVADFLLDRFGTGGGGEVGNAQLLARLQGTVAPEEVEVAFNDAVWGVHEGSYSTIPQEQGEYQGPVSLPKPFSAIPAEQWRAVEAAQRAVPFGVPEDLPGLVAAGDDPAAWPVRFDFRPETLKWGSNVVLVAPSLSRSGQAMLGGGPQMGYFNPEVPWEVGLHGAGVDAVGVGVTGAPGIVLGRTGTFAWSVTSGITDQTDTVALRAAGEEAYLWDDAVRELECRTEVHLVATPPATGQAPPEVYTQRVCNSHVGPVVAVAFEDDGDPEYYFASHKVHRGRELQGANQWLRLDEAKDLQGFRAAFEGFPFTFNFNYAGPEGACYHHVGEQPIRNAALDPRFPTPGGSAWDWQGAFTGAAMPRACNPQQGYYANWNNLPQRGWPSGDNRDLWGSVHRVERLDEEVREAIIASPDGKLDLDQVKAILKQAATHDSLAAKMVAVLNPFAPQGARQALEAWADDDFAWQDADGDGLYDHLGHAWYDAVRSRLQHTVLGDELGPYLRVWNPDPQTSSDPHAGDHGTHDNKDALLLDALNDRSGNDWCDDVATPGVHETCSQLIKAAFAAAAAGNVTALPVHQSAHTPIGAGPAYKMPMTNRATYYHFHVGTDTTQSVSAMPPGQSGHLTLPELIDVVFLGGQGPEHMRDQLPLYVNFEFKPVPVTEAQAQALAETTQTLVIPAAPLPWAHVPVPPRLPHVNLPPLG